MENENFKGIKKNALEELVIEQRITNELLQKIYQNVSFLASKGMGIGSTKPQVVETKNYETVNPELNETEQEQLNECAKIIRQSKESI